MIWNRNVHFGAAGRFSWINDLDRLSPLLLIDNRLIDWYFENWFCSGLFWARSCSQCRWEPQRSSVYGSAHSVLCVLLQFYTRLDSVGPIKLQRQRLSERPPEVGLTGQCGRCAGANFSRCWFSMGLSFCCCSTTIKPLGNRAALPASSFMRSCSCIIKVTVLKAASCSLLCILVLHVSQALKGRLLCKGTVWTLVTSCRNTDFSEKWLQVFKRSTWTKSGSSFYLQTSTGREKVDQTVTHHFSGWFSQV